MKRGVDAVLEGRKRSPPHGGVWIETFVIAGNTQRYAGHPLTGGCGLKPSPPA